jgi:hypothetical protein
MAFNLLCYNQYHKPKTITMIKFITPLILLLFLLNSKSLQAQENIVKLNPLSALIGVITPSYERVINEKSTFAVGINFFSRDLDAIKTTGFGITPEYRFYISKTKEAPRGVYVGPFVRYQNISAKGDTSSGDKVSASVFGLGGIFGHQWVWDSGFALDLFIGPSWFFSDANDDDFSVTVSGTGVRFGVALGFAF